MKFLFVFILLLGINSSCDYVNPDQLNCDEEILVDRNLFDNSPNDSFEFTSVKIVDNCLNITIQYGGGCGNVEFKLIDSEMVLESYPVQRNIRLSLKDEDYCKALITKELSFDLTPIRISSYNQIILNLSNWNEYIVYNY